MMSVRCGDSNLFIVWLTIYWYGSNLFFIKAELMSAELKHGKIDISIE